VPGPPGPDLGSGLVGGAYNPSASTSELRLDFWDPSVIAAYYASDISRFSSASIETMIAVERAFVTGAPLAWSIIQIYYSAFYAAHAIVRILGRSCTYLPTTTASHLQQVFTTVGVAPPFALHAGQYGCGVSGTEVLITPLPSSGSSGSHASFWRYFVAESQTLSSQFLAGPLPSADAQDASARLIALQLSISRGQLPGGWLSHIRNEVQYRHGLGSWFPTAQSPKRKTQLAALLKSWSRGDPVHSVQRGSTSEDLLEFTSACLFLVCICRGLIVDLADRSPRKGKSFVDYGPAKLLRQRAG